jgi:tetratricopeptide (TPR) repeat protein
MVLFTQAQQCHQRGQWADADRLYREILAAEPRHSDALHFWGLLHHQAGHNAKAIELMEQALALNPSFSVYHANLGIVLKAVGRADEALAAFERAIAIDPGLADAHNNRGNLLRDRGDFDQAVAAYREAIRLAPWHVAAHYNLGNALRDQGKLEEAVSAYGEAVRLKPDYVDAQSNLSVVFRKLGRLAEALACAREALRHAPNNPVVHNNVANVYRDQRRLEEALAHYGQAVALDPRYADAWSNLALMQCELGKLAEAARSAEEALRAAPDHVDARTHLGLALASRGQFDDAARCYDDALRLDPNHAGTHWNRALLRLLRGDFEQGWPEYEWRWQRPDVRSRSFTQPAWNGEPLTGRTILLHAEQGLGDTIQFVRYAPQVKKSGGKVIVECQPALVELARGVEGVDTVVAQGDTLPPFDIQAPLASLPGIFHTTAENIPAEVPYLRVDGAKVDRWRSELATTGDVRIAIVWQGRPGHLLDRTRSVPLMQFAPLARVPGAKLFSFQVGTGAEQLKSTGDGLPIVDLGSQFNPDSLTDAAAALSNVDLLVTVDTALAHLAGALARPVWVALPLVPDWRWQLNREDSPWYPTMRLFRQRELGNWDDVFERIATALQEFVAANHRTTGPGR